MAPGGPEPLPRTAANRNGEAMMIPVTYGYARISKSDWDDRNLETQLRELANHGIREELIFSDVDDRPSDVAARMGRAHGPGPA